MSVLHAVLRSGLLWASTNPTLKARLPRLPFVRRAVSRFMPGEALEDALAACEPFRSRGIGSVVTLLGENVTTPDEARAVVTHYAGVLDEIARRGLDTEISVKPTHLGLDLDAGVAARNLGDLAACATTHAGIVWVDMEGSASTQATLDVYRAVHAAHANTGLCIQAYLRRTSVDLERLLARDATPPNLRLVKGAYAEPPAIAFEKKAEVDASFMALAARMLDAAATTPGRLVFGTHDPKAIQAIGEAADARGLPKTAFEFHMLYGIQREEQQRLAAEGYRVKVLISYGSAWFPWYMRRLAERPANLAFVLRNVFKRPARLDPPPVSDNNRPAHPPEARR
jgi:proline dehydrogenase